VGDAAKAISRTGAAWARRVGLAGGGIGAVVLAAVGYFVFGMSPETTMSVVNGAQQPAAQEGVRGQVSDEAGRSST
jgi:hypothetical protein